jgi:hypothetical protein
VNEAEIAAGLPATPQYQYAQRVGDQLFVAGQECHTTRTEGSRDSMTPTLKLSNA